MTDNINPITFEESVRKRPLMYIGNDGVLGLLSGLLSDCIELSLTDEITFEIIIAGENNYTLGVTSEKDLSLFAAQFTGKRDYGKVYFAPILKILSERFEISYEGGKLEINFSLDNKILSNTSIDYLKLSEKVILIALLNRGTEIITIDRRGKYLNQNYYHFPNGIFYLFEKATTSIPGEAQLKLTYEGSIGSNSYQIGIAYRSDWFPAPDVVSFANDGMTTDGGSLVEGILQGLTGACRAYVKENNLTTCNVKRNKLYNGLIIVCSVRGQNFAFTGSFKEALEDTQVMKDVKKVIKDLVLKFLKENKDKADKFLFRFDEAQPGSNMFK